MAAAYPRRTNPRPAYLGGGGGRRDDNDDPASDAMEEFWRMARRMRRRAMRTAGPYIKYAVAIAVLAFIEVKLHLRSFAVERPGKNLDPPFYVGCQEPVLNTSARANAAFVMLARNEDIEGAIGSVISVQDQFNRHFGYPWIFLNDEPWDDEFVRLVGNTVRDGGGGTTRFEVIPKHMWDYPPSVDQDYARKRMAQMEKAGVTYAEREGYHHMCRFNSGMFYDHPALKDYRWYWRVEPDIAFTCAITYDPFVEMERHDKKYGYTLALWELPETTPSLWREMSRYKKSQQIPTTTLWTAMRRPSHLPWPLRKLSWWMWNRDDDGDVWNLCHFWSNFEIADMDFFRSKPYRDLFRYLDDKGGFYYERWGDAPVHSLAAALLLRPEQVHHFADIGYLHPPFQYCTFAATDEALARDELVPNLVDQPLGRIPERELGCRCNCDPSIEVTRPACFNRLRRTVM